jgi:hypothetical protein
MARGGGAAYQVRANVSQYVILHETRSTRSGSQIPRDSKSSVLAPDARSIGTSRTMQAGSHSEKKIGTR